MWLLRVRAPQKTGKQNQSEGKGLDEVTKRREDQDGGEGPLAIMGLALLCWCEISYRKYT